MHRSLPLMPLLTRLAAPMYEVRRTIAFPSIMETQTKTYRKVRKREGVYGEHESKEDHAEECVSNEEGRDLLYYQKTHCVL